MEHASLILPTSRLTWATAMRYELDHIDSDFEAFTWAAGCVLASYVERSHVASILQLTFVRVCLTILIAGEVLSALFATVLSFAYRLHFLGLATFLGSFTPGDDYHRFIPLMETTPWWLHAIWLLAALLFVASGWQLLRKRCSAFPLFAAAWILSTAGDVASQMNPVYREVFSFPEPMLMRDYVLPTAMAVVPVFIAAALWAHGRFSPERIR